MGISDGIARIRRAGKAAGILSTTQEQADKWLAAGAQFVAVGIDTALLASAAKALRARFPGAAAAASPGASGY